MTQHANVLGVLARGDDIFDALGDGRRRRILALLAEEPRSITQLADILPVSRPAVSKHLNKLRSVGLVAHEVQGTSHVYRLHDTGFVQAHAYLDEFWDVALARFKIAAENL